MSSVSGKRSAGHRKKGRGCYKLLGGDIPAPTLRQPGAVLVGDEQRDRFYVALIEDNWPAG